jgi:hypothetical protein
MHINRGDKMPGFDGTGPRGFGPMTGGGRGFCTGYLPSAYFYQFPRYQIGFLPRPTIPYTQYRYAFSPYQSTRLPLASSITPYTRTLGLTYTKEQEIQMLEQQTKILESHIEAAKKRLAELNG